MKLIGTNGFKESGKDTTFDCIRSVAAERHEHAVRRAFADNLKIAAAKALGYDAEDADLIAIMNVIKNEGGQVTSQYKVLASWDGSGTERLTITGRKYLQLFGQKHREVFGDSFWVDQILPNPDDEKYEYAATADAGHEWLMTELEEKFDRADYGVVTDVRYPNEAERVLNLGGVVLEIVRPGTESDGHASERPLPREYVTHTIVNDGTVADLQAKVAAFLGSLD